MSISRLSNHLYVVVTTIISLLVAPSTFHAARASHGSHGAEAEVVQPAANDESEGPAEQIDVYSIDSSHPSGISAVPHTPLSEHHNVRAGKPVRFAKRSVVPGEGVVRTTASAAAGCIRKPRHDPVVDETSDFIESRQFKRNLAVSKYRDNPHWLSNYTWKSPEKFDGPRKKPSWEMDTVTESKANPQEQEELQKWEQKMREVSNRQREKWKTYEAVEKSQPNEFSDRAVTTSPSKVSNQTSTKRRTEKEGSHKNAGVGKKVVQDTFTGTSAGWNKSVHNGRWGMSGTKPAVKGSLTDSPTSLEKTKLASQRGEGTTLPTVISNGRWGMSVKEAPKEFSKELSRKSQTLKIPGRVWKEDEDPKSTGNRKIHDRSEVRAEEVNVAAEPVATELPKVSPSSRGGMSSDSPPREFLREISRRRLAGIPPFYKSQNVHQREHEIAKNNPRSPRLMFLRMPELSNIVLHQPFPSIAIEVPMFPSYLTMRPNIWPSVPNYNVAIFSYIINQSEFL